MLPSIMEKNELEPCSRLGSDFSSAKVLGKVSKESPKCVATGLAVALRGRGPFSTTVFIVRAYEILFLYFFSVLKE